MNIPRQLKITLSMPPSTNTAYRNVPRVGRVKTDRALEWHKLSSGSLLQQRLGWGPLYTYPPPYKVILELYFADRRRCDIANREKLAMDLLVDCHLIENDSLIDELIMRRMVMDKDNPRIEITIENILNPQRL